MSLEIFWTPEAQETFDIIVNLIEQKWGFNSACKFISLTYQKVEQITLHPYMFRGSISENVRQVVITRQTSLFYEVNETNITLLFFMDNRQEPFI